MDAEISNIASSNSSVVVPNKIGILGLGQIGQAFLCLNFFLAAQEPMEVHLVDSDTFEEQNYRSQLLLNETVGSWDGRPKVEYLSDVCTRWGWKVTKEKARITWGWTHPMGTGSVAFLGFDNMEARRVGVEAGFVRLVECGVGTDFLKPHISWHSLPPERQLARMLFVEPEPVMPSSASTSDFLRELDNTPGKCGRVMFENIQAPLHV